MTDSGWTVDTLKEHFDKRFDLADRQVITALAANEKRLDAMNEFRATLADQARDFMPRLEAEQRIDQLTKAVDDLQGRLDMTAGRSSGLTAGWGYLVGFAGLFIAAAAIAVGAFT